jgi:hypothetical protein
MDCFVMKRGNDELAGWQAGNGLAGSGVPMGCAGNRLATGWQPGRELAMSWQQADELATGWQQHSHQCACVIQATVRVQRIHQRERVIPNHSRRVDVAHPLRPGKRTGQHQSTCLPVPNQRRASHPVDSSSAVIGSACATLPCLAHHPFTEQLANALGSCRATVGVAHSHQTSHDHGTTSPLQSQRHGHVQ